MEALPIVYKAPFTEVFNSDVTVSEENSKNVFTHINSSARIVKEKDLQISKKVSKTVEGRKSIGRKGYSHSHCFFYQNASLSDPNLRLPEGWEKNVHEMRNGNLATHFFSPNRNLLNNTAALRNYLSEKEKVLKLSNFDLCPYNAGSNCPVNKREHKSKSRKSKPRKRKEDSIREQLVHQFNEVKSGRKPIQIERECPNVERTHYKINFQELLYRRKFKSLREAIVRQQVLPIKRIINLINGEDHQAIDILPVDNTIQNSKKSKRKTPNELIQHPNQDESDEVLVKLKDAQSFLLKNGLLESCNPMLSQDQDTNSMFVPTLVSATDFVDRHKDLKSVLSYTSTPELECASKIDNHVDVENLEALRLVESFNSSSNRRKVSSLPSMSDYTPDLDNHDNLEESLLEASRFILRHDL